MNDIEKMIDIAIKEKRKLTQEEVQRVLRDPTVQDALKDPLARFVMLTVFRTRKVCKKITEVGKRWNGPRGKHLS